MSTPMNSCCPNGSQPLDESESQPLDSTLSTALTASLSSGSTLSEVNINLVNVFKPMGCSPIPADICLVGLDDDLVDEFDTPLHNTPESDNSTCPVNFDDAPCNTADPCNWQDDNIDKVRTLIDTGAMVTCTGQQHAVHGCDTHTKLQLCPI